MTDNVNHPKHYNSSPFICECGRRIECIDVTRHMNFNIGNVIKYLWRAQFKNGLEDLRKAQWYLNDAVKTAEESERKNYDLTFGSTCTEEKAE